LKPRRPKLTYSNAMATIAVFIALGGTGYAAFKLPKKSVGAKQLKKNAVTAAKIKKNAVAAAKIAPGAVTNAKLADGAVNLAKIAAGTNVIASATAGPIRADQNEPVDVPLNPPMTLTAVAGQPITVNMEARGTLAQSATNSCAAYILARANGDPLLIGELFVLLAPSDPPNPAIPNGIPRAGLSVPVGLTEPGKPQNITVQVFGDPDCTSGSTVDQIAIVATQVK
jgi:hypothetical protein